MNMAINNVFRTYEIYSSNTFTKPQRMSREEEKRDIITLSNQAKDFQTAYKALSQVPDIREEKVLDIQNRISYGEYNISSNELASKLLENI